MSASPAAAREPHVPIRTCILSRREGTRDALLRLALSPDGEVLPDVRARAPGRGAWLGVDRAALDAAMAKGKLRGALARAFKGAPLSVPDDLARRIEGALARDCLDRLGLEARAGMLVAGSERIEAAARKGEVHLLLHAADARARLADHAAGLDVEDTIELGDVQDCTALHGHALAVIAGAAPPDGQRHAVARGG